ncbi:cis-3-alkyl-4-alkyloxetan-2-one decarboxylase [Rhodamnia argentea]|uniref:Cis-3-alkyl-4-alkyloxetan-2-one decarboxylase n=1 Tax=Rhodamnia argentea TaxID=178133 RepID=A0A8B8MWP1_9MYRT|nr:cis-3-alkyl-4-alkyloxetan-2-one decarboxylase [Rhodamnia argentea]
MAIQASQAMIPFLHARQLECLVRSHKSSLSSRFGDRPKSAAQIISRRDSNKLTCKASVDDRDEDYLIDAPVSAGDGFSFTGGKYSDGPSQSDEWFKQGKMVKAFPVVGSGEKAKDPIFGLTMGSGSQSPADIFRWFCVESGIADNPLVLLVHGFPSQAYSYRKILPILSKDYHAIAFDWIGFGFSDKPQPGYGFNYTLNEYVSSLESLINSLGVDKVSLVVQGYFSPVVVKYARKHQEKLNHLILLNPPLTSKHANLPSSLSIFSNFLLGEIFSQDPLRASDKALTSCGPYKMKEDDAMVYRRPYLTSGSSGFALNAISRAMRKELKNYVEETRMILKDESWKVKTTVCWGQRDRWLGYDGVEEFCKDSKLKMVELPMAGHHVQEDSGEELGKLIAEIVGRRVQL